MSGGILGCHIQWVGAREASQHPPVRGTASTAQNDPVHVNSVEAANLPQRAILGQSLPPWGLHCSGGKWQ